MSDVTINYKGSSIATMDASGTKTLLTEGQYCEDDIEVVYVSPGGGGSSKSGSFTPSSNLSSYTITDLVNTSLKNFLVRATPQLTSVTGNSVRAFAAGAINITENIFFSLGTNSSGSSVNTQNSGTIGSGNVFKLNTTTGVITVSTGSNGSGYLVSGVTYDWWAW